MKQKIILAAISFAALSAIAATGIAKADNYTLAAISPDAGTFTNTGGTFKFVDNNVEFIDNTPTSADYLNSDYLDLTITGSDTLVAPGTYAVTGVTATDTAGTDAIFDTLITPLASTLVSGATGTLGASGGAASLEVTDPAGAQLTFGPTGISHGAYDTAGGSFTPAPETNSAAALAALLGAGGLMLMASKRRSSSKTVLVF